MSDKSKHFVLISLIFLAGIRASKTADTYGNYLNPDHPEKCTITNDIILSVGDVIKDPFQTCGSISCGRHGMAQFQSCGSLAVNPPCRIGAYVNERREYPNCCEREITC